MKTFKKYSNRKYYSTELSGYVRLKDILDVKLSGEEVKVHVHSNGKDITEETLREALMRHTDLSVHDLLALVTKTI